MIKEYLVLGVEDQVPDVVLTVSKDEMMFLLVNNSVKGKGIHLILLEGPVLL